MCQRSARDTVPDPSLGRRSPEHARAHCRLPPDPARQVPRTPADPGRYPGSLLRWTPGKSWQHSHGGTDGDRQNGLLDDDAGDQHDYV